MAIAVSEPSCVVLSCVFMYLNESTVMYYVTVVTTVH